ncbi:hypothetical protein B296_00001949 [Ensete ventricosum]|uniref:Uncharacterized protein n=1 Tax=Ensete ventricosum TaxID=4639 RepID=A0A427AMA5_ENSVE|nr:hypothetical protein B296_00001949 [Ensete ventricosum]
MVMEMLTTRRGSWFRRATGSDEEEEVGARQAAGSGEGWLRLRWLQREEDEEGTVGGDYGSKGATTTAIEAQMCCGSRKRRWCYYAPTGKKKELAAAAKQRRRSAGDCEKEVVAVDCSGCSGRWQGWPAVMKRRNYGGRRRKKQPRERK